MRETEIRKILTGCHRTVSIATPNIVYVFLELHMEYATGDIGMIRRLLSRLTSQCLSYLRPISIASESGEQSGRTISPGNRHAIMVVLIQIAPTAWIRSR